MIDHDVRVSPSKAGLKREDQLAWKLAGVAVDKVAVTKDVAAMIVNRVIDNASVAIASANRHATRGRSPTRSTPDEPESTTGVVAARPSPNEGGYLHAPR